MLLTVVVLLAGIAKADITSSKLEEVVQQTLDLESPVTMRTICNFQSDEDWERQSVTNGTAAADTTNYMVGSQGLKLTTNSNSNLQIKKDITLNGTSEEAIDIYGIGVWFYLYDFDVTRMLTIDICEDNNFTNYYACYGPGNRTTAKHPAQNGWNFIWLPAKSFSPYGSPAAWGTGDSTTYPLRNIRIRVTRVADGANAVVTIGKIVTFVPKKAGICITFDDNYDTVHTNAFPIFQNHGYKANVGIISGRVRRTWFNGDSYSQGDYVHHNNASWRSDIDNNADEPGVANWTLGRAMGRTDSQELYDAGWDLLSHLDDNTHVRTYTAAELADYCYISQQYLQQQGWDRGAKIMVWPGNGGETTSGDEALTVAADYYDMIRGNAARNNMARLSGQDNRQMQWYPEDIKQNSYIGMNSSGGKTFANNYQTTFEQHVARGEVINCYTHSVEESPSAGSVDAQFIEDLLNWVDTKVTSGEMYPPVTYSEWYNIIQNIQTYWECNFLIVGDFNDDCKVNLTDLALIVANWLKDCEQTPGDPDCKAK